MTAHTEGLRKLADFLDEHPEFDNPFIHFTTGSGDLGIHIYTDDKKTTVKRLTRAFHGTWAKDAEGSTMYLTQKDVFDYFDATIYVNRDAVCERKLVGTQDVEVPAVEAAEARVDTVPIYEWECKSIFANERELVSA